MSRRLGLGRDVNLHHDVFGLCTSKCLDIFYPCNISGRQTRFDFIRSARDSQLERKTRELKHFTLTTVGHMHTKPCSLACCHGCLLLLLTAYRGARLSLAQLQLGPVPKIPPIFTSYAHAVCIFNWLSPLAVGREMIRLFCQ